MKKITSLIILVGLIFASCETKQPGYLNTRLSFDERVNDLVSRMTLEQKVSQLRYDAPGIDSLNIHAYNWWNECLHGVARSGIATVFPQAIGMAAMWDDEEMFRIATAISDEARAKHHEYATRNKRNIYQGLTYWTPNINIFRDPRWGRGMETYGEDPYLTGELAVDFIKGLQGDDPKYFKLIGYCQTFYRTQRTGIYSSLVRRQSFRLRFARHLPAAFRKSRQAGRSVFNYVRISAFQGFALLRKRFPRQSPAQRMGFSGVYCFRLWGGERFLCQECASSG
jgi:hypothetical protein